VAAAVQQRLVTVPELREALDRVRRHQHRKAILLALADVEMGAQALSEIDFARLCRSARLPEPDRQVVRSDPSGRRRYLDAEWDAYSLTVEIDGAHHAGVEQWNRDLDRQNEEVLDGKHVLRFSAVTVRTEPARVLSQLRRAMRRAS
jgi:very-short-patch-repair endonuclease